MQHYDPVIQQHLLHPQKRNAQYLSADIQNEVIQIIGDTIRQGILDEVTAAKYFTLMADEAESHNKQIMPLCVRFVDKYDNIREEFLEFCSLKRITGEAIAGREIKDKCTQFHLDLADLRGQCYDGASCMSGSKNGVQAIIMRDAPKAAYVHCNSHCLNLVIAHSSAITEIDNTLKQMKEVSLFFNYSPKREGLLTLIIARAIPEADRRRPLLQICETRWAARQESYRHFYQAFTFIVTSLEVIVHNMHDDLLDGTEFHSSKCVWDKMSKSTASSLYHAITSFNFIITFLVVYMTQDYMDGLSRKLQQRSLDIIRAYQMVGEVQSDLATLRENFDERFEAWYCQAERMGQKVGTVPEMPRIASRQQHRANAVSSDDSCSCKNHPCQCDIKRYYIRNISVFHSSIMSRSI